MAAIVHTSYFIGSIKFDKENIMNVSYNTLQVYDRFTIEHLPLCQRTTLTIKIYCSKLYIATKFENGSFSG
jgi:hypothetical protein